MKKYFRKNLVLVFLMSFIVLIMCCSDAEEKEKDNDENPATVEVFYDNTPEINISGFGNVTVTDYEICVIFNEAKLASYIGKRIFSVKIYNSDTAPHAYKPRIFMDDAGVNPPALVRSNTLSTTIASHTWQTINLDSPLTIQASKVYWAGYVTPVTAGVYPLAVGAEADYGNNRTRSGGSGAFGNVDYNWIVKLVIEQ